MKPFDYVNHAFTWFCVGVLLVLTLVWTGAISAEDIPQSTGGSEEDARQCTPECGGECEEERFVCEAPPMPVSHPPVPPGPLVVELAERHVADGRIIELTPFEFAVWMVETGGKEGPILGDGGRSRGPLQISRAAWIDALEFDPEIGGRYEDVDRIEYAVAVQRAYLDRYCGSRIGEYSGTWEGAARVWNGGPDGCEEAETVGYAEKVLALME
jgi:hypothetical protein